MAKNNGSLWFGLALFLYLGVLLPSTPSTQACAVPEGGWIALGDSITYGMSSSTYDKSWVGLLSTDLGETVDNRAVSGAGSDGVVSQIGNYEGVAQNAVMLCCINDLRAGYTVTNTVNNVSQTIIALKDKEFQNIWIAPHVPPAVWYGGPVWWAQVMARREDIAQATRDNGANVVWISGFNPNTMLVADGLHPNDEGHQQIERYFWSFIRCDFRVFFPFLSR